MPKRMNVPAWIERRASDRRVARWIKWFSIGKGRVQTAPQPKCDPEQTDQPESVGVSLDRRDNGLSDAA